MRFARVVAALLAMGVWCETAAAKPGRKAAAAAVAAECRADADCVLVTDGCCGCSEGGKQRAIPGKAAATYEKKRKATCKETMCAAVMSDHPSCAARAVCKEGTCALGS